MSTRLSPALKTLWAFLVFGIVLSRLALAERTVQARMVGFGIGAVGLAEGISIVLMPALAAVEPALAPLATTEPVPPMPLYMLAGLGMASIVIGVCLRVAPWAAKVGLLGVVTPAGRQTLTLYIAHVLIGMGALDALGMLGGQSLGVSVGASVVFCALATVYAWLWARVFKRGPIEAAMRAIAG